MKRPRSVKCRAVPEHRQSRCSAIESLQAVFRWDHQFAVKMALPGKMPEALILRPQIDRGSNILLLLGPAKPVLRIVDERAKALSYFPGVCLQSETARRKMPRGPLFIVIAMLV